MNQKLMPWHWMLRHGQLDEMTLEAGSFLSDREIKDKYNHTYYPHPERLKTEIKKSTIFWYPPGIYKMYPSSLYGGEQREIAGIFLKDVIPDHVQKIAFDAMEQLKWANPRRAETRTAIEFQQGRIAPKELNLGSFFVAGKKGGKPYISQSSRAQLEALNPLFNRITEVYARTLPFYFGLQNSPRSGGIPTSHGIEDFGGIPGHLRQGVSAFSGFALLRSCPASIHKDQNARRDQTSFACLTSIGSGFSGGTFCLIEYGIKIPIKPGDLFIGQTTREWHYNTTPVDGLKYSIVCYWHKRLANPKWKTKEQSESPQESKEDH